MRTSSLAVWIAAASGLAAISAMAFGALPNLKKNNEPKIPEETSETTTTATATATATATTTIDTPTMTHSSGSSRIHHPDNNTQKIFDPHSIHQEHVSLGFPFYDYLLRQLNVVVYAEDRDAKSITSDSGRNKPSGLVGLACLHCLVGSDIERNSSSISSSSSSSNLPQYNPEVDASVFPQDRRSLARDVSTKMYHHVSNCDRCPTSTKEKLRELHQEHETKKQQNQNQHQLAGVVVNGTGRTPVTTARTSHVSREERLFFRELWYRMGHKEMAAEGPRGGKRRPFDTIESQ